MKTLVAFPTNKQVSNYTVPYGVENIAPVPKKKKFVKESREEEAVNVTESDDDVPAFNMDSLDWSKLAEARLIDYPDPNESGKTIETSDAAESTDSDKETKTDETKKSEVSDIGFDGYDYDISPEDLHYDY